MTNIDELPGNSHKMRLEESKELNPRKVDKIIKGQIVRKKQSWLSKFLGGDDTKSVGDYILWDVLIPAAKTMIIDAVNAALNMRFYGETKYDRIRRDKGRSYVSYNSMSRDHDRSDRPDLARSRTRYKFDDVVIESLQDAEEVLAALVDMIDDYGVARVADFYDAVGVTTDYPDQKWGWDNLSRATVNRVRDGYILVLPKPYPLD